MRGVVMATAGRGGTTFLLLGGSGAGKTLLVKRLQNIPLLREEGGGAKLFGEVKKEGRLSHDSLICSSVGWLRTVGGDGFGYRVGS